MNYRLIFIFFFGLVPLGQAATLHGRVHPATFEGSNGPAGAQLELTLWNLDSDFLGERVSTVTDASGAFQVEVGPGSWRVFVDSEAEAARGIIAHSVEQLVQEGDESAELVLNLIMAEHVLSGTVKSTTGIPIQNAFVFASQRQGGLRYSVSGQTDFNGEFDLRVASGAWDVSVSSLPDGVQDPVDQDVVIAEDTRLEFTVEPSPESLTVTPAVLPMVVAGEGLRIQLSASGGGGLYSWALAEDSAPLPSQLELDPLLGILRGTVLSPGTFEFTVEVSEAIVGDLAGRQDYTLVVTADASRPMVSYDGGFRRGGEGIRANSGLAFRFTEPMLPVTEADRPAFRLERVMDGQNEVVDPESLSFHWLDGRERLIVSPQNPLELGDYRWTFNPESEGESSPDGVTPFTDFSGNPIEQNRRGLLVIGHGPEAIMTADGPRSVYRDIADIALVKERVFDSVDATQVLGITYTHATVSLPPLTRFTVVEASWATPDGEVTPLNYDILSEGSLLHERQSSFASPFDPPVASSLHQLNLTTIRNGAVSIELELEEDGFPRFLEVENPCEAQHIDPAQPFDLLFPFDRAADGDELHLIITERFPAKLYLSPRPFDLVFEAFAPAAQGGITIPSGVLAAGQDYSGVIRLIKTVDRDEQLPDAEITAGLVATTEFQLSTTGPRIACIQASSGLFLGPEANGMSTASGQLIPVQTPISTSASTTGFLSFGQGSTIHLRESTSATLNASGQAMPAVVVKLLEGTVVINRSEDGLRDVPVLVETPAATAMADRDAEFSLSYDEQSQMTGVAVVSGRVRVTRFGPDGADLISELIPGESLSLEPFVPVGSTSPRLEITHAGGAGLRIGWESADAWVLESTEALGSMGGWERVSGIVSRDGLRSTMTIAPELAAAYFRLVKAEP